MFPTIPVHKPRRMLVTIPAFPHHILFLITLTQPNFPQILFPLSLLPNSTPSTITVAQLGAVPVALADVEPHPAGLPLTAFSPILLLLSQPLLTVLSFLPQAISVREATTRRSSIRVREVATGQTRTATSANGKTSECCHHWHLQHLVLCAGKGLRGA